MDYYQYVLDHKNEIIESTLELLKIPSVLERFDPSSDKPFGKAIYDALIHMIDKAQNDGFITKNIENYAAHIEYGSGKDILGILCHLDVVPTGDGWTNPPFSPVIRDGKIFARGSNDDKGPTMAAYFALKFLKELDFKPSKRIRIILGTDEETGWRGITKYFETEEMPTIGFAPDAMFPLIYAEKGFLSFDVNGKTDDTDLIYFKAGDRYNVVPDYAECSLRVDLTEEFHNYLSFNGLKGEIVGDKYIVYGKRAHAMQPHLGINAAFVLAKFLDEHIDNDFIHFIVEYLAFDHLGEKLNINYYDPEMKEFTINPAVFNYDHQEFTIGVNCRYPKGWDVENAKINISAAVKKYKFRYHVISKKEVHYIDKNDPLVQTLYEAYVKYTDDTENQPFTIGGGTYARSLQKGVAFGAIMPGRKDTAHQVDEFMYIEDILKATAIYMEAIYQLCK
jgi:succinyl-diaminopimelate desuccinylase